MKFKVGDKVTVKKTGKQGRVVYCLGGNSYLPEWFDWFRRSRYSVWFDHINTNDIFKSNELILTIKKSKS